MGKRREILRFADSSRLGRQAQNDNAAQGFPWISRGPASRKSEPAARSWFVRLILEPCVCGDPVDLPGCAAVSGKGLLEMAGIRRDVRDDEANKDGPAIECFLVEELTTAVFEGADRGLAEDAATTVGKIQAPLMRLRVVKAERERFDVAFGSIDLELDKIGAAIPNLADDSGAVVFDPSGGTGEGMQHAPEMGFPAADFEIEIVLAVAVHA